MPLSENKFFIVNFKPTTAPEWGVLDQMPLLSPDVLAAVVSGAPLLAYVTQSGPTWNLYTQGSAESSSGVGESVLASAEELPMHSLESPDNSPINVGRLPDGDMVLFGGGIHRVARYSQAAKDLLVQFLTA